jgi:hypothetical protein
LQNKKKEKKFENEASSFGDFFSKISDETNLQKVKKLKLRFLIKEGPLRI